MSIQGPAQAQKLDKEENEPPKTSYVPNQEHHPEENPINDCDRTIPEVPVYDFMAKNTSTRHYTPIAPNPSGLLTLRRSISSPMNQIQLELSEEDRWLLHLKDDEELSWRDIAVRFQMDMGKAYQVPALQMRLKRLRERLRVWTDIDVQAIRMALEFWATNKFEIIAAKVPFFLVLFL
jgi:hypothetical protein